MDLYGTYCDLTIAKAELGITDTDDDALLLRKLEAASRMVDEYCRRHFYAVSDTRIYSPGSAAEFICPDDILSVATLKTDQNNDRTWGYTWVAADYELYPYNGFPKWKILRRPDGDYSFLLGNSRLQIAGLFGYGDGQSATPYKAAGSTVTVATTTGTSVTASSGAAFAAGNTFLAGSEQMYVEAVSSNTLTVVRGVNGTTPAVQAAAAAYLYQYPRAVREVTLSRAKKAWRAKDSPQGSAAGEFGPVRTYMDLDRDEQRMLWGFRKAAVA